MPEYGNIDVALAGLQIGVNATRVDGTFIAQETIGFGSPVMSYGGQDNKCWGAHQDQLVATMNQALASSDVLSLVINGTAFTKTGTGTSDTDMIAYVAAINANTAMIALNITASLTGSSAYRTITLKAIGVDLTVVVSCTPYNTDGLTFTGVYSTWASFLGVALFNQRGGRDYGAGQSSTDGVIPSSGGTNGYMKYEAVNILSVGRVWVVVAASTENFLDSAYLIFGTGATQNQFTNVASATANKAITGRVFMTSKNSQGLAILSVNDIVQ